MESRRRTLVSTEQVLTAVRALGFGDVTSPGDDQVSHPEALGMLVSIVEYATMVDVDRLDQEALRHGYLSVVDAIARASAGHVGLDSRNALGVLWRRLLEDRLQRTDLDIVETTRPVPEGAWTPIPAIRALLDAVLALVATTHRPEHEDTCEQISVLRDALRSARLPLMTARQHLEDGHQTLRKLGYES